MVCKRGGRIVGVAEQNTDHSDADLIILSKYSEQNLIIDIRTGIPYTLTRNEIGNPSLLLSIVIRVLLCVLILRFSFHSEVNH